MSLLSALNARSSVRRALIVVDMSVEQVAGIRYNLKSLVANCQNLCCNSSHFFELIMDSRLWLRSKDESGLAWVWPETYVSMFVADSEGASLVADLRPYAKNMQFVEKYNYCCFANSKLLSILQEAQITEVYICGSIQIFVFLPLASLRFNTSFVPL
jgi:nicotinamidase-related amidase